GCTATRPSPAGSPGSSPADTQRGRRASQTRWRAAPRRTEPATAGTSVRARANRRISSARRTVGAGPRPQPLHPLRLRGAHLHPPGGEPLDAGVHRPGARLELELPVLDLEILRARLLPLELGEEFPRVVLGRDQSERAGGEHYEQYEANTRHGEGEQQRRTVRGSRKLLRDAQEGAAGTGVGVRFARARTDGSPH